MAMPHHANINTFAHTAIVVSADGMGQADTELRQRLITNYFRTLFETNEHPQAILVYASGVKLLTEQSPCLAELRALAKVGVPIIACRTCLEYYGLIDKVAVGDIGNMLRIVEAQGAAQKIITL